MGPIRTLTEDACAPQNRFLVIFGGGSVAHCYNDVTLLDTKTNEWSCPQTEGTPPTPRAGATPACSSHLLACVRVYHGCNVMLCRPCGSFHIERSHRSLQWKATCHCSECSGAPVLHSPYWTLARLLVFKWLFSPKHPLQDLWC